MTIAGHGCIMFFDIENEFDERRFLILMYLLNGSSGENADYINIALFQESLWSTVKVELPLDDLTSLYFQGLVRFWNREGEPTHPNDVNNSDYVGLTFAGMAVLINAAGRYLDDITVSFDVPNGVLATLVPYLDITRVPAADRYVSTADNQEAFNELAAELEKVKDELVRDQNANELPIPVQTKRAMAAELDGLVGQIRAGYVRISDLTQRARPLVKSIADTCKDIGVIGGFAYAAYEIIGRLLGTMF
jgi:hypothetical protein